jgi:hypothetical protein
MESYSKTNLEYLKLPRQRNYSVIKELYWSIADFLAIPATDVTEKQENFSKFLYMKAI